MRIGWDPKPKTAIRRRRLSRRCFRRRFSIRTGDAPPIRSPPSLLRGQQRHRRRRRSYRLPRIGRKRLRLELFPGSLPGAVLTILFQISCDSIRKGSILLVRSDEGASNFFNARPRSGNLITNAVAVGRKLMRLQVPLSPNLVMNYYCLRGLEEEMDQDPRVCVMVEDVGPL
ncbi:pyruvate dehydrogenase E1 component subunit [Musa troglodytarum]|uniref:Pyruvate dehydrogenase E1 component subunit n=1 Tax=Musa troglodytarum TaxID=320322 RepID=A0A9E7JZ21_9LILI|nr:pyruvate dehydrogenase E1 component subunit [Musa troglodytarum]